MRFFAQKIWLVLLVLLLAACSNAAAPTATTLPPTATTLPLNFALETLLQTPTDLGNAFTSCSLGPLELNCPAGGELSQARTQMIWATRQALMEGFVPGASGAQIQVSLFSVFEQGTGVPEQVLAAYVKTLYPAGVPDAQLIDGPQNFLLDDGQTEVAAVIFRSPEDHPRLVNVFLALEKHGRVATIGVLVTEDRAAQLLPVLMQGVAAFKFNVTPISANANELLPAGSSYALMGSASKNSRPDKLFTSAEQAVFIEVQPLDDANLLLALFDEQGNLVASSDRPGKEYLFFDLPQTGQYDYLVTAPDDDEQHPYVLTIIATDGVTIGAGAPLNAFACRLAAGRPAKYMLMINEGEVADITVAADNAEQQLQASIFSLGDLETPLLTASGAELDLFTFEPPTPDWYLLSITDASGASGSCFVGLNYVKP